MAIKFRETVFPCSNKNALGKLSKHIEKSPLLAIKAILKNSLRVLKKIFFLYIPLKFIYSRTKEGYLLKIVQKNLMLLNLKDVGISRELAVTGVHESASTKQTKKEIKKGMNVLEIGANIGYYALIEARLIGKEGKIYAIEPDPNNMKALKMNIALNNIENRFEIFNCALGGKKGREKFYTSKLGNLSSFVNRDDDIKATEFVWMDIITGDDFLKDKKVDYIRMDIEGYELEAIKGMRNTLNKNPPKKMYIEVHSELLNKLGNSAEEFLNLMASHGYDISKAFYRGNKNISVNSMKAMMKHPRRELGYWETFFVR